MTMGNDKQFTEDWTTPHVENWMKHLAEFVGEPGIHALEIGCFEGKSSLWFVENILTGEGSNISCIDTFEGGDDQKRFGTKLDGLKERFLANTLKMRQQGRIWLGIGKSSQTLKRAYLELNEYDFIYLDASHLAEDVLEDSINAWAVLKPR
jgi:predicted O-methyltransferase YrrM